MNYMYLMKKIADSVDVDDEDVKKIKKIVEKSNVDFTNGDYEKEINKYLDLKSKDLYC